MPIISYGLDARSMSSGTKKVNSLLGSISSKAKSVGSTIGNIFSPLKVALAGAAGGFGAVQLAKIGDEYTNMASQLEYLAGSSKQAEEAQGLLYEMSQRTRTSVLENSKALTRFSLASEMTGLNMEQNIKVLGAINTNMIKTGVSTQEASSAMIQLGQALASGRLQGDEFRTLSENTPALMNELAKSLGVSRAALKEMGAEGKLTSEILGKAFLEMANNTSAGAAELPLTVGGMWQKVINATQRMWDIINDKTGILAWVSNGLDNLSKWVEQNTPTVVIFFEELKAKAVDSWPAIKMFFVGVQQYAIEVGKVFVAIWPIARDVMIGIAKYAQDIIPQIRQLVDWITNLINKMKTLAKYTPVAAIARAAGTVAGGGGFGDAASAFFDADGSDLQPATQSSSTSSTQNTFNFNQQVSRSDVSNIVTEANRQNSRG